MLSASDSLPIQIEPATSDYFQGTLEVRGLIRYQNQALLLEYRTTNLGFRPSEIATRSIPLHMVRSLAFKSSIFGTRLIIEVNTLTVLKDIPGAQGDRLVIRIPWKARKAADSFYGFVLAELSEIKFGAFES